MLNKLMLASMLTILCDYSFAKELVYPIGKGDLIISNNSETPISITNYLATDDGVSIGDWQVFPDKLDPKQTFKVSLTQNIPANAVSLVLDTNGEDVSGFIFDSTTGELFLVPGGIKQDAPKKGIKLINLPKN